MTEFRAKYTAEEMEAVRKRILSSSPQTIEIDCPPGGIRPGDLITQVVAGTPLEGLPNSEPDADVSRLFGNWTYDYSDIDREQFAQAVPLVKKRLTELYNKGIVRYASW